LAPAKPRLWPLSVMLFASVGALAPAAAKPKLRALWVVSLAGVGALVPSRSSPGCGPPFWVVLFASAVPSPRPSQAQASVLCR